MWKLFLGCCCISVVDVTSWGVEISGAWLEVVEYKHVCWSSSVYLWFGFVLSHGIVFAGWKSERLGGFVAFRAEYNGTLNCMKHTWVLPSLWIYTGLSLQMNTAIELTYNINVERRLLLARCRGSVGVLRLREPNLNLFPTAIQNGHINLIIRCVIRLADERLSLDGIKSVLPPLCGPVP